MLTLIALGSASLFLLLNAAATDTANLRSTLLFKTCPALAGVLCAFTFMVELKEMFPTL